MSGQTHQTRERVSGRKAVGWLVGWLVSSLAGCCWVLACLLLGHWVESAGIRQAWKYRYMAGRSGAACKFNTRPGMMPMEFMPIRKRPTYPGRALPSHWVHPLARVALLTAEKL